MLVYLPLRPSIRFSSDEVVACRLATNEIQFFDAADFSKGISHRLRIPGVAAVELSKAPGSHVAAFVPESKVGVLLPFAGFIMKNKEPECLALASPSHPSNK